MKPNDRILALDGLRALAVTAVILSHTLYDDTTLEALGTAGVRLFFVISGYLITRILLDHQDAPQGHLLKTFYLRRFLRICPVYFVLLGLVAMLGFPEIAARWPWYVTYTSNLQLFLKESWPAGRLNHLWSLAVEEQFYLIWPWLVLWCPRDRLLTMLLACILIGPLFRVVLYGATHHFAVWYQMPACADQLGMGALLAWLHQQRCSIAKAISNLLIALTLLVTLVLTIGPWKETLSYSLYYSAQPLVESLLYLLIIDRATRPVPEYWVKLLAIRPMTYVGMISYGIYLWHGLLLSNPSVPHGAALFAFVWLASLGLATVSWYSLEKPLNELRHRFKYRKPMPDVT